MLVVVAHHTSSFFRQMLENAIARSKVTYGNRQNMINLTQVSFLPFRDSSLAVRGPNTCQPNKKNRWNADDRRSTRLVTVFTPPLVPSKLVVIVLFFLCCRRLEEGHIQYVENVFTKCLERSMLLR